MKIGIFSDTHGVLRENVVSILKECDYMICAGDTVTQSCYLKLKELGVPFYIVKGNCDKSRWADYLPETLIFSIGGQLFYLIHDAKEIAPNADAECKFIISGHTHKYANFTKQGQVCLNPGSTSSDRGSTGCTMMLLHLDGEDYRVEQIPV